MFTTDITASPEDLLIEAEEAAQLENELNSPSARVHRDVEVFRSQRPGSGPDSAMTTSGGSILNDFEDDTIADAEGVKARHAVTGDTRADELPAYMREKYSLSVQRNGYKKLVPLPTYVRSLADLADSYANIVLRSDERAADRTETGVAIKMLTDAWPVLKGKGGFDRTTGVVKDSSPVGNPLYGFSARLVASAAVDFATSYISFDDLRGRQARGQLSPEQEGYLVSSANRLSGAKVQLLAFKAMFDALDNGTKEVNYLEAAEKRVRDDAKRDEERLNQRTSVSMRAAQASNDDTLRDRFAGF